MLALHSIPALIASAQGGSAAVARRVLLVPFVGTEAVEATRATSAARSSVAKALDPRRWTMIPGHDVDEALGGHWGLWSTELASSDLLAVTNLFNADVLLYGWAHRRRNVYEFNAFMLVRGDSALTQPLGTITSSRSWGDAAVHLAQRVNASFAQMTGLRDCIAALATGRSSEAISRAREAIVAYQEAVPARVCLARALQASNAATDLVDRIVLEVLVIDSTNSYAKRVRSRDSVMTR